MLNKYTEQFMDDHDLKVEERFKIKDHDGEYWFDSNGVLDCDIVGNRYYETAKLLYGDLEVEKIKKEPWKPKLDEKYWFVSQYGFATYNNYCNDEDDKYILTHYPIFQTEEEAKDYKWFLDKIDEYKRPFEPEKRNYCFYYDNEDKRICTTFDMSCPNQGTIYFGDEDNSYEFSKEVGEERMKKYWFNIWE